MVQPKFTSGEWVRDGTLLVGHTEIDLRLDDDGENWITIKGDDDAIAEANAALVLAAPTLYAALRVFLEARATGSANHLKLAETAARSAIAKADGDAR